MKSLIIALAFLVPSLSMAATTIDSSRATSQGVIEIQLIGGEGSAAEKLFLSLSKVEEVSDNAMGHRYGSAKQGRAVECFFTSSPNTHNSYSCYLRLSTAGESVPGHE